MAADNRKRRTVCCHCGAGETARPLLRKLAEQRTGALPDRADIRYFFRLFTLFWACYFIA
jgi:hypothetical protein